MLILGMSDGTYSLKVPPNDRFLRNFLMGIFYLLSEFLPVIYWEKVANEIFRYFRFDVWPGDWTRALRLISQHLILGYLVVNVAIFPKPFQVSNKAT